MTPSAKDELIVRYHEIGDNNVSISLVPDDDATGAVKELPRKDAIELIFNAIRVHAPSKVVLDVMGKRHFMAKQTVQLIINGELTAADMTAV